MKSADYFCSHRHTERIADNPAWSYNTDSTCIMSIISIKLQNPTNANSFQMSNRSSSACDLFKRHQRSNRSRWFGVKSRSSHLSRLLVSAQRRSEQVHERRDERAAVLKANDEGWKRNSRSTGTCRQRRNHTVR